MQDYPTRRVRFVLKVDVPAILELRVTNALHDLIERLPVTSDDVSLTRGEYLDPPPNGEIKAKRLRKYRDITPKGER